ncbi:hypothetical protein TNCT_711561 [Trichonephila clavata]|uniref:Uncharacterized protein n=1 Tax=Trichonephila clavata TaxID=2740835 RepID=A0A8X6FRR9_TRICU|nr:hypothetical protein TNCT_711561 [Trichonephila clavata]
MANNTVLRSDETMAGRNRSPETKCLSMMKLNRIMDQQYRGSIISPRNLLMAALQIAFTGFLPIANSERFLRRHREEKLIRDRERSRKEKTNLHLISPDEIQLKSASSEWREKKNSTLLLHTHISLYASSSAASQDPLPSSSICLRNLDRSPSSEETRKNILGKKMKQKPNRRGKKDAEAAVMRKNRKRRRSQGKNLAGIDFLLR